MLLLSCDHDKCCVRAKYPTLVPEFKLAVVEEVLVMDTGVDPSGVDAGVGGKRKKAREINFPKGKSVCLMERVAGTQFGDSYCGGS